MSGEPRPSPIVAAFPAEIRPVVERASVEMPSSDLGPARPFSVLVDGEQVWIPYRIYNPRPAPATTARWGARDRLVLDCIYTRHHDGRVRERSVRGILGADDAWVVPFVVHLIGEYVVEIIEVITESLHTIDQPDDPRRPAYAQFVQENRGFIDLTAARVASYWDCYHRGQFPRRAQRPNHTDYPGHQAMALLRSVG